MSFLSMDWYAKPAMSFGSANIGTRSGSNISPLTLHNQKSSSRIRSVLYAAKISRSSNTISQIRQRMYAPLTASRARGRGLTMTFSGVTILMKNLGTGAVGSELRSSGTKLNLPSRMVSVESASSRKLTQSLRAEKLGRWLSTTIMLPVRPAVYSVFAAIRQWSGLRLTEKAGEIGLFSTC
jgi:hypothetical protein